MISYLSVALGGALGAILRYGIGLWFAQRWLNPFPLHTFLINVSGSFLLGFLYTLFSEKISLSPTWQIALTVGFLGAFTTFSTFGYETVQLLKGGSLFVAALYILLSVGVGLIGVWLGINLARFI